MADVLTLAEQPSDGRCWWLVCWCGFAEIGVRVAAVLAYDEPSAKRRALIADGNDETSRSWPGRLRGAAAVKLQGPPSDGEVFWLDVETD
jgi:hypothetical protein